MARKKQTTFIEESKQGYDYFDGKKDGLSRDGSKIMDIYLLPSFRKDTLGTLYRLGLLKGQVLIDWEKEINDANKG